MSINFDFVKGLDSEEVEGTHRFSTESVYQQQFRSMRRRVDICHIHDVAYILTRNVISKQMVMFISCTATVQLDVTSRGFFAEIGQL